MKKRSVQTSQRRSTNDKKPMHITRKLQIKASEMPQYIYRMANSRTPEIP